MAPPFPVDDSLTSFWRANPLPLDDFRSTPELPAEVDIAIIGAGYAGASTVYHILKSCKDRGVPAPSIAILEARQACSGATGRNGGQLKPDPFYRALDFARTRGMDAAVENINFEMAHLPAIKKLVEEENIDCDFVLTRCCDVFFNQEHWTNIKAGIASLQACGPDKVPSLRDMFVTEGIDAKRLSGVPEACGLVTYSAGHVWPYKLIHALLTKALAQGVNLQTHTPVTAASTPDGPDGLVHLATARGTVRARRVVYATNAYTSGLLPEYAGRIIPVRGICSHIAVPGTRSSPLTPTPPSPPPQLVTSYMLRNSPASAEYLIPRLDGSIIVGGARPAYLADLSTWYDNVRDDQMIEKARHYFDGYMQRTFSGWENSGAYTDKVWTGILGYSADNAPHVGVIPGRKNQFIIAGFTGHGMPQVFLSTKGLADMVLEDVAFEETDVPRMYKTTQERLDSNCNQILESWEKNTKILQKL